MKTIETNKYFALLEETETAYKLIKFGFGELQNIRIGNAFYFLPFQLLSQGFERFMKVYICLGYYDIDSNLPDFKYIKDKGHNLETLLETILNSYYKKDDKFQFVADYKFLTENNDLKELLYIISEFGKMSRYYNFDIITNNPKVGIDAIDKWKDFENRIMKMRNISLNKLFDADLEQEVYYEINNYIIEIFEKFISALSRQFIFGFVGDSAKSMTVNTFYKFGMLYEKDFGKTDYRKLTTSYKELPRKKHKRNFIDRLNRKYNSDYKFMKITKSDYKGDWPFYTDKVVVECRQKHWCVITIDGYDYALNGSAKGRYKLENPHDAGVAILGKSIGEFITLALNLK
jgi:hypothetical protein